jgi:hypothetical protein
MPPKVEIDFRDTKEEPVRKREKLTLTLATGQFDSVQILINGELQKSYSKTEIESRSESGAAGVRMGIQVGPRGSKSIDIVIPEHERILHARAFKGGVCVGEAKLSVRGGDSRVTAIIIGIEQYQFVRHLKFAEDDAKSFENLLKTAVKPADLNTVVLYGASAKQTDIMDAIYRASLNASENGAVLVYFSGHGTIVKNRITRTLGAYFVPWDGDPKKLTTLLPGKDVSATLAGSMAARKILISDSCFSGIALDSENSASPADATSKSLMDLESREFRDEIRDDPSWRLTWDGKIVWFSSSGPAQVSYESATLGGGLFTHYLLNSDPTMSYRQKHGFIAREIGRKHAGVQTPELLGETTLTDMLFPLLTGNAP